ncbi:MAG: SAM-dependent methyltransferase [Fluviicola sp.]|nr:MAG: SAM-dependent methyltransferase [Fluviicola sp.]
MSEFWELAFRNNDKMWGENPTDNAKNVLELLQKNKVESVLIPGFGYGRNAKVFLEGGIHVSGIEISKTAIERARKYFKSNITIHHGSVTEMPFDNDEFESIYCYSLVHLLGEVERSKLIRDCYSQLATNGIMIFVALSSNDKRFGVGQKVSKNTFKSPNGLNLYFYEKLDIEREFKEFNIIEIIEIDEPEESPTERHWMVICKKNT